MKKTTKNYANFYNSYHTKKLHPIVEIMQRQRIKTIKSLLPKRGKILIAGCGSGNDMSIVGGKMKGYGADISKEAIKKSKIAFPQYHYQEASITKLPFDNNFFEVVVCSEVIEHVPNRKKALAEIRRVLKNNGIFIITTPNWLSFYGFARWLSEKVFKKPTTSGNQPYDLWSTPSSLRRELVETGFRIDSVRGIWYYPPFGKGMKQISAKITLPIVNTFNFLNEFLGISLPWFGHMILFKTRLAANNNFDAHGYWRQRHKNRDRLAAVGGRCFSKKANFYATKLVKEQYAKIFKKIELSKGNKILDAGSGIGLFTKLLLSKGFEVDAADISSSALKYLKEKNPSINTICKSLSLLPDNKQYDAIHCFDVLYHITCDKEWELTLKKFSKIAKKYIILHERFPNRKPPVMSRHVKFYSYNRLKNLLDNLGFEEYLSVPTHFIALRLPTYRISKLFPKIFYMVDKKFLNSLELIDINLADKFGSHHIKVFRKIQ